MTIQRLWEEYKINNPALKGIVTDQNRYDNYIDPHFGGKEPNELIPLDVDRLRIKLLKTKSPGTVKNILELLRRIINFGVKKIYAQDRILQLRCRGLIYKNRRFNSGAVEKIIRGNRQITQYPSGKHNEAHPFYRYEKV